MDKSEINVLKTLKANCPKYFPEHQALDYAISFLENYENRLKSDMVAMLTEIQLEIEEKYYNCDICEYYEDENDISGFNPVGSIMDITDLIQQKINALKGE